MEEDARQAKRQAVLSNAEAEDRVAALQSKEARVSEMEAALEEAHLQLDAKTHEVDAALQGLKVPLLPLCCSYTVSALIIHRGSIHTVS